MSAEIAQSIDEEAKYIKNKGFNDQYYKDMIVDYINKFGKANRKQLDDLLWDKLPNVLDDKQKKRKVLTLLTSLRKSNVIVTDSDNRQTSNWIIKKIAISLKLSYLRLITLYKGLTYKYRNSGQYRKNIFCCWIEVGLRLD
mgnify:CR=1 FL=1